MEKNKKECPACAMEIDAGSKVCPICGYEFPAAGTGYRWIAIVLIIILLMYLIFF